MSRSSNMIIRDMSPYEICPVSQKLPTRFSSKDLVVFEIQTHYFKLGSIQALICVSEKILKTQSSNCSFLDICLNLLLFSLLNSI